MRLGEAFHELVLSGVGVLSSDLISGILAGIVGDLPGTRPLECACRCPVLEERSETASHRTLIDHRNPVNCHLVKPPRIPHTAVRLSTSYTSSAGRTHLGDDC